MIHHFYHIYADGAWRVPLQEHAEAISKITEPIKVQVGIVGEVQANRISVMKQVLNLGWDVVTTDERGWEQITLDVIWATALEITGPVLYAHTKGAANCTPVNHAWRRCMTRNTIGMWEDILDALGDPDRDLDLVGSHWLTPEAHPEMVQTPYFGGNFWWASHHYLRDLPPPSTESRYHAEAWVGQNEPNIWDLRPGWPGLDCRSH